ncbi:MAG: hypothetical protein ACYTG5_13400, partial [Planctomycetota bacterium]
MSEQILTEEMPVLLTRGEVRKLLRVNEKTIDCWLRGGRLEQLPASIGSDSPAMIALQDAGLRERFEKSVRGRKAEKLAFELLPAVARFQLLQMMMDGGSGPSESGEPLSQALQPMRRRRRSRLVRRSRRAQASQARLESAERKIRRSGPARKRKSGDRRSRRLATRVSKRRSGIHRRQGSKVLDQGQYDEVVDMLFPPTAMPPKRSRKAIDKSKAESTEDLSALQQIAEVSDQPEVAEELWGDELLSLVRDVAESVADQIGDRIQVEQQVEPEAFVETEFEGIDPKSMPGGEDEIWLALEGVEDSAILKGTEDVLFSTLETEVDGSLKDAQSEPEVFEVELVEDPGGEMIAFLVDEEQAHVAPDTIAEEVGEGDSQSEEPAELEPEVGIEEQVSEELTEKESLDESGDDDFLELELEHDEWMPAEEM